jgi:hypothetical protein
MIKPDFPLQPIPIAYYAGDGCKIFNYDLIGSEEAQKWQVSRYVPEILETHGGIRVCTPQRLFLDGKWSSDWNYENEAEYEFPSAAAAWDALKRAREADPSASA